MAPSEWSDDAASDAEAEAEGGADDIVRQLERRIEAEDAAERLKRKLAWADGTKDGELPPLSPRSQQEDEGRAERVAELEAMIDAEAERLRAFIETNELGGPNGEDAAGQECVAARQALEAAASAQAKLKRDHGSLRARIAETRKRLDRFAEARADDPMAMLKELEEISASNVGKELVQ